jgi:phosphate transport system substrate-binding protein
MRMPSSTCRLIRSLLGLALVAASACNSATPEATTAPARPVADAALSGALTIDGSRTVLPVSTAIADAFRQRSPNVHVAVTGSDTAPGFQKLCNGEIEIADASRPIDASELQQCASHHIEFIELPIAFDSLTVVVNKGNTFADCLTVAELKKIWEPAADGKLVRWDQVRSGFPSQPLTLFGPGAGSGTFDYFTLAVVGANSSGRKDYTSNADLAVVADGVAADPNALGFFGYAYYVRNKDRLKAVSVDGGHGCVAPNPDTVTDMSYVPLGRPLFVYLSTAAASRPEVKAFADFYVDPDNAHYIRDVGYMPLPPATLLSVGRRLDTGVTGSVFGGRGSVLGVRADTFQDDDRIKSAIVR